MNIILTMAGKYTRFQSFGRRVPKYLLPISHQTMLGVVMETFIRQAKDAHVYLIANKADQLFVPVLEGIMRSHNVSKENLIYISDTPNQVATASMARKFKELDESAPTCFANIDTVLYKREMFFEKLRTLDDSIKGLLDTFPGDSKEYSYCIADKNDNVIHVAEKKVISQEACSGLYGFSDLYIFKEYAKHIKDKDLESFSDLYNLMVNDGLGVSKVNQEDKNSTIVLGTPEEYVKNIHRFKIL